jgi:hypothetical protein
MARRYVEALIRADLDDLWSRTQDPSAHQRWDARFGEISYVRGTSPQRFRHASFGIAGLGATVGEARRPDGQRTSALRFASDHRLRLPAGLGPGRRPAGPAVPRLADRLVVRPAAHLAGDPPLARTYPQPDCRRTGAGRRPGGVGARAAAAARHAGRPSLPPQAARPPLGHGTGHAGSTGDAMTAVLVLAGLLASVLVYIMLALALVALALGVALALARLAPSARRSAEAHPDDTRTDRELP